MTTPLEVSGTFIVILLSAIATWVWIKTRKQTSRNWDFKERSLQYLNDVERKKRRIPVLEN